jgi:hypothetical protein
MGLMDRTLKNLLPQGSAWRLPQRRIAVELEYSPLIPTDGLVALYDHDGDATDSSGNGNHGTPTDITYTTGKAGQAASFNGSSSVVSVPTATEFDFEYNEPFSISFPVQRNGAQSGDPTLAGKPGAWNAAGYGITDKANESQFRLFISEGSSQDLLKDFDYPAAYSGDEWCHLVFTYDGSSTSEGMKLYADGVKLSGTNVRDTLTGATIKNANPLRFGVGFDGLIDEVRIYNRALSAAEVAALNSYIAPSALLQQIDDGIVSDHEIVKASDSAYRITVYDPRLQDLSAIPVETLEGWVANVA